MCLPVLFLLPTQLIGATGFNGMTVERERPNGEDHELRYTAAFQISQDICRTKRTKTIQKETQNTLSEWLMQMCS